MAKSEVADGERKAGHRRRSYSELEDAKVYKSRGKEKITLDPDLVEVRRIRLERLGSSTGSRRSVATSKMTSDSHTTLPSVKSSSTYRRKKEHHRKSEDSKHRRRRRPSSTNDDSTATYVYGPPSEKSKPTKIIISETRKLGSEGASSESEDDQDTQSEPVKDKPRKRKVRVIYVKRDPSRSSSRHKDRRARSVSAEGPRRRRDEEDYVQRSSVHKSRQRSVAGLPSAPLSRR